MRGLLVGYEEADQVHHATHQEAMSCGVALERLPGRFYRRWVATLQATDWITSRWLTNLKRVINTTVYTPKTITNDVS
ncbi:Protein of unknown function [Gryllus bimaculatus]|nr:Protein of unknown function [Gryllus bimaculatus]